MNRKTKNTIPKIAKKKSAPATQVQYVFPIGNGWLVKNSAKAKFTVITDNKREAVTIARNIARLKHIELIVYYKNGNIQEKVSYAL